MGAMDRDWYHERRDGAGKLRRSPSGRVPQWALDDAVGVASDPHPWRAPATHSRRRRRAGLRESRRRATRTRSSTTAIGVVLLLALLSRALARVGARRRGRAADRRLRNSIDAVAREEIVLPVERVLERHGATRLALSRAATV